MESGAKQYFIRVNIPNPRDHLLMHQQRLEASTPGLHEKDELIAWRREGIDPEAASTIAVEACLIEQRKPSEPPGIPIAQFRFAAFGERHADMHMLRMFRLCRTKEEEAGHAKLSDDISMFALFLKLQRNALAISLHPFQSRTAVPRERGQSFPNDIRSSNPTIVELSAEEMSP